MAWRRGEWLTWMRHTECLRQDENCSHSLQLFIVIGGQFALACFATAKFEYWIMCESLTGEEFAMAFAPLDFDEPFSFFLAGIFLVFRGTLGEWVFDLEHSGWGRQWITHASLSSHLQRSPGEKTTSPTNVSNDLTWDRAAVKFHTCDSPPDNRRPKQTIIHGKAMKRMNIKNHQINKHK